MIHDRTFCARIFVLERNAVMKKLIALLIAVLALWMVSCATPPVTPETAAPEAELAQAKKLKQKADAFGLAAYAQEKYDAAAKDLQAGEDAYGKDNAAAKQSLDKSIQGFNEVIDAGGALYLGKRREKTDASKKAADDLKSSVAVKDSYAKAKEVYDRALEEAADKDLENASKDFDQAMTMFDEVAKEAKTKKEKAEKAMAEAEQDMAASEQKAADAEKSLDDEGFTAGGKE
jgi:hypothetical protein